MCLSTTGNVGGIKVVALLKLAAPQGNLQVLVDCIACGLWAAVPPYLALDVPFLCPLSTMSLCLNWLIAGTHRIDRT
jgi:hypothetical protein